MAKRLAKFPEVVYRKHPTAISPHPSPWVRKPGRHFPTFLLLFCLSCITIAVDVQIGFSWLIDLSGKMASPIIYSVDRVISPIANSITFVRETWEAKEENLKLEQRVEQLEKDLDFYQTEFHKNRRYRELLNLKAQTAPDALAAEVLRYQDSATQRMIYLRAGRLEGINPGQAVITEGGQLLGRVLRAGRNSASVLLITDPSCRIGIAIESTQAQGILYNRDGDLFVSVDRTEEVDEGDRVLTSHLSGIFQEGLLVGEALGEAGPNETDPLVAVNLGLKKSYRVDPVYPIEKWEKIREVLCLPTYDLGNLETARSQP